MPLVEWPAIEADVGAEAKRLLLLLRSVMARGAEGLKRALREQDPIAFVWRNVISDCGSDCLAFFQVHGAQGMRSQLCSTATAPQLEEIPITPRCCVLHPLPPTWSSLRGDRKHFADRDGARVAADRERDLIAGLAGPNHHRGAARA